MKGATTRARQKYRATIWLPEGLWRLAKKHAVDLGVPFSTLVAEALNDAMTKRDTRPLS